MATPLILPNFRGNLVTVLTGFHCIYQYRGRYLGFATVFYTCEDVDDVTLVTTNTQVNDPKLVEIKSRDFRIFLGNLRLPSEKLVNLFKTRKYPENASFNFL